MIGIGFTRTKIVEIRKWVLKQLAATTARPVFRARNLRIILCQPLTQLNTHTLLSHSLKKIGSVEEYQEGQDTRSSGKSVDIDKKITYAKTQ